MKFLDVIISIVLISLFCCEIDYCLNSYNDLFEKKREISAKVESNIFISESFRKTCTGEGFSSLTEWQKVCKSLWNLDYIGFAEADSFMIVENTKDEKLFYGKWIGTVGNGEVYCRRK